MCLVEIFFAPELAGGTWTCEFKIYSQVLEPLRHMHSHNRKEFTYENTSIHRGS